MSPDEISGGREPVRRPPADQRGRRRLALGVVALVVVVAAVSGVLLTRPSVRHPTSTPPNAADASPLSLPSPDLPTAPATTPGPPVGIVTVGSDGVALLADPGPEVLDVTGGRAVTLASGAQTGSGVDLSPDGRYVAAISSEASVEMFDLSDDVRWVGTGTSAAWSPVSDTLAVLGGPAGVQLVRALPHGYEAVGPDVTATDVPAGTDLAWSPDGRVAVGVGGRVVIVGEHGDVEATSSVVHGAMPEPVAWAGDHLVVFDRTGSGSIDSDGVGIQVATVSGDRVTLGQVLGQGLPRESWWHAVGGDDVLGTLGPYRYAASDKRIVRCDLASATCTTLAGDSRTSAFDAVPTASGIAYLSTPNSGDYGETPSAGLVLADRDGSDAHAAADAPPATQVVADGDLLLLEAVSGNRASIDRYDDGAVSVLTQIADGAGLYEVETPEIVAWWRPDHAVVR